MDRIYFVKLQFSTANASKTLIVDTKSESARAREHNGERARGRESERAREREGERARERESERARESDRVRE